MEALPGIITLAPAVGAEGGVSEARGGTEPAVDAEAFRAALAAAQQGGESAPVPIGGASVASDAGIGEDAPVDPELVAAMAALLPLWQPPLVRPDLGAPPVVEGIGVADIAVLPEAMRHAAPPSPTVGAAAWPGVQPSALGERTAATAGLTAEQLRALGFPPVPETATSEAPAAPVQLAAAADSPSSDVPTPLRAPAEPAGSQAATPQAILMGQSPALSRQIGQAGTVVVGPGADRQGGAEAAAAMEPADQAMLEIATLHADTDAGDPSWSQGSQSPGGQGAPGERRGHGPGEAAPAAIEGPSAGEGSAWRGRLVSQEARTAGGPVDPIALFAAAGATHPGGIDPGGAVRAPAEAGGGTIEQLAWATELAAQRPERAVRLVLQPEGMGTVAVRVAVRESGVGVQIGVDNPATRELVQASWPQLQQALDQRGLTVQALLVDLAGGQASGHAFRQELGHQTAPRIGQVQPADLTEDTAGVANLETSANRVDYRI